MFLKTGRSLASLLPFAWIALVVSAQAAPSSRPMDLAPFGQFSTWGDNLASERFLSLKEASARASKNLGLEWREERDVQRIHLQFAASAPQGLKIQYWFHTWPATPPEMPTIEDQVDDPWQGKWLTAEAEARCQGAMCDFTFRALAATENPNAKNLPGVHYRRTLKLRLASDGNLPAIVGFKVFSDAVEKPLSLRISLGHGDPKPLRWTGLIEIANGRLISTMPMGFVKEDALQAPNRWSFEGAESGKGVLIEIVAAGHSLPGTLDCTLVTVRAKAGNEDRSFTFNVDDLSRGPIYIPAVHAYVTKSSESAEFRQPTGKGPHIRSLIPEQPDQSYQRASREIPPLDPWQDQYGRPIYMPLAPDSSWQKFAFQYGGNVFISRGLPETLWASGTKAMGDEKRRLLWDGERITWKIGTGRTPYYREDRKASIALEEGYLPVIAQSWESDGLKYKEEAFTTLLRGPLSPRDPARSEQTPAVMMLRLQASNPSSEPRTAHIWLNTDPGEDL